MAFGYLCVLLQNYIARFGHGSAKLARQAQSKEKTLQKMMASGLTERVVNDKVGSDMGLHLEVGIGNMGLMRRMIFSWQQEWLTQLGPRMGYPS